MDSPKINLAMDNCFAIKRWISPSEWIPTIKGLGIESIEASTDNEIDPLFSQKDYFDDWFQDVVGLEQQYGMKVRSFFTGYQTYRTAGLAHPDPRVRSKIRDGWFKPLIIGAEKLDADIGFSFHAIREADLESEQAFRDAVDVAIEEYASLAAFAHDHSGRFLCCEQMYAPYQHIFTIQHSKDLIKAVSSHSGDPFYIAVDVGHMIGQKRFSMPSETTILDAILYQREHNKIRGFWLGPEKIYDLIKEQAAKNPSSDRDFASALHQHLLDKYGYIFSIDERDQDPYAWLEDLGAYSPIIHLQQTNGVSSPHAPFTEETNRGGIIKPEDVLKALAKSYSKPDEPGMPQKTDRITLAFEIFIANLKYPHDSMDELKETVAYWKRCIPRDGMTLDELLKLNGLD